MKKTEDKAKNIAGAGRRAGKVTSKSRDIVAGISPVEMKKVLHELNVYQRSAQ